MTKVYCGFIKYKKFISIKFNRRVKKIFFICICNFCYHIEVATFRLNNMLIKVEYPVQNTIKLCGDLPFNLDSSVKQTILWLNEHKMIKNKLI